MYSDWVEFQNTRALIQYTDGVLPVKEITLWRLDGHITLYFQNEIYFTAIIAYLIESNPQMQYDTLIATFGWKYKFCERLNFFPLKHLYTSQIMSERGIPGVLPWDPQWNCLTCRGHISIADLQSFLTLVKDDVCFHSSIDILST